MKNQKMVLLIRFMAPSSGMHAAVFSAFTMGQIEQERTVYKLFPGFELIFRARHRLLFHVLLWLGVAAPGLCARGQVVANWTGKGNDSLWTDQKNWDTHAVPGSNDTANIDLTGSNLVVLNTNAAIGTINLGGQGTNILELAGVSIQCTGSVSIANGGTLEITGNSDIAGGSVQNSGTITVPANLGTQSLTLMCNFANSGVLDAETNSVLSLAGTNSQFVAGTVFSGSGVVLFPAGSAKINCSGTMSVVGTVEDQQAVSGTSTWVGPGLFQWLSGSISNVTFAPTLTVKVSTSSSKVVYGACTNQGTMIWMAGAGGFDADVDAHFFNSGVFQLEDSCSLGSLGSGIGVFENDGTVDVPAGLGVLSLTINCGFFNHGTIDVETNSILDITTASPKILDPVFSPGTVFGGAGTVELTSSAPITGFGQITVNGTVELNSTFNSLETANTIWTGSGLLQFTGGEMSNVTFAAGFNVQMVGPDSKTLNGVCTNLGTILYLGTGSLQTDSTNSGQFYNAGLFEIETNCALDAFTNFQNTGTIEVPAGLGELSLTNNCSLINYGTIDVETSSVLSIVTPYPGPGITAFESGTVFAGPGTIEFGPNGSFSSHGTITVDGTIILEYAIQAGDAIWTGPGLLQLIGGEVSNATFAPGFNVQLIGSDFQVLDGACTNQGTIRVLGTGGLDAPDGGQFCNAGLFQIETNCDLSFVGFPTPYVGFQNTGTIKIPPGLGELSLTIQCAFTNYGVIEVETNSTVDIENSGVGQLPPAPDFESGTVFAGPGTVQFSPTEGFNCDGTITVDGTVILNSGQGGNAVWTGPGLLEFVGGVMNNVTFGAGFNVQLIGSNEKDFNGACTNQGTMRILGTGSVLTEMGGQIYNRGLFQIETNCDLFQFAPFQNTGTIRVPPGLGALSLSIDCPFTNSGVIDVETNSELSMSNSIYGDGSQTYLDGTTFNGPGIVFLAQDGGVSCSGTMTVNGTVELQLAVVGGPSTWTGPGLLLWQNSEIVDFTFAPGFHVQASGFESDFPSGNSTNEGTICLSGALEPTGVFYNYGTIRATGDCTFQAGSTPLPIGTAENFGTITVPADLGSNSLTINCNFTNLGTIAVGTNSELSISNGPYGSQTYLGGTVFGGSGMVILGESAPQPFACYGAMTVNGTVELQQSVINGQSTWTGPGSFVWQGGELDNFTFAPGFNSKMIGTGSKVLNGACTNQGTVLMLGTGGLTTANGQLYNSGMFQVETDGVWSGVQFNNQAAGTFRQLAGTISVPSFSNMGSVQVVSGFLNVASNFLSCTNSSYQVTVNGTTPGISFNQLNAQNLTLNGSLQIILTNGFSPAIGNSFAIMNGTRSGSFTSTALPAPQGNLTWQVQYAPVSVVLEVGQPGGALTNISFANGAFQFSLNGFPTGSYDIQASSNLLDWATILTNYPFSGSATVTDTNAPDFGNRFYRARFFP